MRVLRVLITPALIAITMFIACGGDGNIGQSGSDIYLDLLDSIPDTLDTRSAVYLNNYEMAANLAGIEKPGATASADEVVEYVASIRGRSMYMVDGPYISGFSDFAPVFAANKTFRGFDQRDITAAASAGTANAYEVIAGRFDPDDFEKRVGCPNCDRPEMERHRDTDWYRWGEDLQGDLSVRHTAPLFDHIGRGGNVLFSSDTIRHTLEKEQMVAVVDTITGEHDSLRDRDDFASLVTTMNNLGAYSLYLTTDAQQVNEDTYILDIGYGMTQARFEQLHQDVIAKNYPALVRYSAMGIGSGRDAQGPFVAVAFWHDNDGDAIKNTDRLGKVIAETPRLALDREWSEFFNAVEASSAGRISMFKLRSEGRIFRWPEILWDVEPLFAYE